MSNTDPTDVTGDDPILTGKSALARLNEFPDYRTRLKRMDDEAGRRWTVLSANQRFLSVRSGRQPTDRIREIPSNHGKIPQIIRCRRRDSNPRHADYDSAALTD
jgi:hypothetical protein